MIEIEFDISNGWRPDLTDAQIYENKALSDAKNVEAYLEAYWPVGWIAQLGTPSSGVSGQGDPRSGVRIRDTSNNYYMVVGSQQGSAEGKGSLYLISSTEANNVSNTASGYSASGYNGANWDFEQFGNWVLATNYGDPPQILKDLSGDAKFEDMGNIPAGFKAKYVLFNNGHMIWANYYTTADQYITRGIIWSAQENVDGTDAYTPDEATGAGNENFPELDGEITGITSLKNQFVIYAERSLVLSQYTGGTGTFEFIRNPYPGIGCYYPKSLISIGDINFFWSDTTIYAYDGTQKPVDIGKGVMRTVTSEIQSGHEDEICSAHDLSKNMVYWLYPTGYDYGLNLTIKKILAYNYVEDKFTYIQDGTSEYIRAIFSGVDQTDTYVDTITESVDSMSQYVDSASWSLKKELPAILLHKDYFVTGGWEIGFNKDAQKLEATIKTGSNTLSRNVYTVGGVRTGINSLSMDSAFVKTAIVGTRMSETESYTPSSTYTIMDNGFIDTRTTGRQFYIQYSIDYFTKLSAKIIAEANQTGRR